MKTAAEILGKYGIKWQDTQPGRYYTTCPKCSAARSRAHQCTEVLGITIDGEGVQWGCNHCGWTGGEYFNSGSVKRQNSKSHIVAVYDYVDENGNLLFQVCRRADKTFPQRKPDGNGGWIWTTVGIRKVLYRLPELIEAVANEHVVVIVEGEKDVEKLWKIGVPATCNPGGASEPGKKPKWRREYSGALRGADVVIIPDHDEPGRAHVEAIAQMSAGIAKRVRILDLAKNWAECPKGGDVSDWLAAGHTREELDALIEQAPDWAARSDDRLAERRNGQGAANSWKADSFTAVELQSMTFAPILWIVSNIIPAEGVTLLCSKPKFGKSFLAYDLCIACTSDRFTLGTIKPAQGDVLYLALEDSKRRLQRRMAKLLPTGAKWPDRLMLKTEWRRLHEGGLEDIRAWHVHTKAKGGRPILVVIDVLAKVRKPVGNRPVYEADYAALADLTKLANEIGLAIVVVHHTRKMAADDLMETVSGSYGVSGAVDTVLVMATKASGVVLDIRGRDVESAELAIEFNKDTCRWRVVGPAAEVHVSKQRAKIMAALAEAGEPLQIAALIEATGMKRNPVEVLLGRMVKEDAIKRAGKGLYAHKDYIPPSSPLGGSGKRHRQSVAESNVPTDRATDSRSMQRAENNRQNTGTCPSVASVRESTDTGLGHPIGDTMPLSVPAQTDQTDRQIGSQAAGQPVEFAALNLSGDLSRRDDGTDDRQPADDDFPELPRRLRRVPVTVAAESAPALGPPGDSLNDFQ